jgi:hypothetical protein
MKQMALILVTLSLLWLSSCGDITGGSCCRICRTGCACGDGCISCSDSCHMGGGCACNGLDDDGVWLWEGEDPELTE